MVIKTRTRTRRGEGEEGTEKKELKLPDEFLGQVIKEVVMHEVGHSLGLRHNFKASTMLRPDQINDTAITRAKGMTGSVMDYNPINIAPKGQKQGDYATTTIGPYDYWAIEYAYTPIDGDEEAELKKIAARSPEPDLVFATDEDFSNNDPWSTPTTWAPTRSASARCGSRWPASCSRTSTEGRQGRRVVGAAPRARSRPAQPVGQRRRTWRPSTSAASRSTATSRGATRPATRSRRSPAPGSARRSSSWSTRSSATRRSSSRPACSAS